MSDVEALSKALAAEHAAVYAYGLMGARTTGSLRSKVAAAFAAHRARRDQLRALISSSGGRPAEPEATYALPVVPANATEAVRLAVHVEAGITAAYLELSAAAGAATRKLAALAMQESVTRSYGFRPAITAFPGMPVKTTPPVTPSE
ncbi:ferritin-like domain-containing protein [Nonomuraea africana]|uniref:Rubrerythrin n=1 Tax=Nonomuraea africana TaxID=46171 RepID=A0ABR9KL62_9ACTN|nr:ferritin-like domain-containing protein [Nonomuraea africana]MBE1562541.1 rubrerythrin [Nonomuraea africana]